VYAVAVVVDVNVDGDGDGDFFVGIAVVDRGDDVRVLESPKCRTRRRGDDDYSTIFVKMVGCYGSPLYL